MCIFIFSAHLKKKLSKNKQQFKWIPSSEGLRDCIRLQLEEWSDLNRTSLGAASDFPEAC